MKSHALVAAAALLIAASVLAQTSSDANKQQTQNLSHADAAVASGASKQQ